MNRSLNNIQRRIDEVEIKLQEMEQLNSRMTDQMRELYLLYEISRQLCTSRSSKEIFQKLTRIFRQQFYIEEFAVMIYRPKSGIIEIEYSYNLPKRHLRENFFKPGKGLVGKTFNSGKPLYVPNIRDLKKFKYFNLKSNVTGCLLYVPLILDDSEKFGLIKFRKPVPHSFSDVEKNVLTSMGNLLAVSLKNAFQYDAINKNTWLDSVTLLHNRKYFQTVFKSEFKRSQRYQHSLSVISLTIEDFPQVEKTIKRTKTDQILKMIAESLIGSIRSYDGCFYFGSGQFWVLLPETEKTAALEVANKIEAITREGLEDTLSFLPEGIRQKIGVATYPADTIEPPDLLKVAQANILQNHSKKIMQS